MFVKRSRVYVVTMDSSLFDQQSLWSETMVTYCLENGDPLLRVFCSFELRFKRKFLVHITNDGVSLFCPFYILVSKKYVFL